MVIKNSKNITNKFFYYLYYGVEPRSLCLLCRYWAQLHIVARVEEYYGLPFRRERGVTQGDPLSPTTFNVVVDAVVCHWGSLVAGAMGGDIIEDNEAGQMMAVRTIRLREDSKRW